MTDERTLRQEIVRVGRVLLEQRLTRGTSGNVSARSANGMLITPSAVPFDELTPEMLMHVVLHDEASDAATVMNAEKSGARLTVSTEWQLHAAILRARPEVQAVIHTHSPHCVALACLRRAIPPFHYMVAVAGGDDIRCADYALFGTEQLARHAVTALADRTACLLANHGAIAVGTSLQDALALAIEVEALAEQYCHTLASGEPVLLNAAEMSAVRDAFVSYRRKPAP